MKLESDNRLIVTILLLLLGSEFARAESTGKWRSIGQNPRERVFVDIQSVKNHGDFGQATVLTDHTNELGDGSLSHTATFQIDCVGQMARFVQYVTYSGHMAEGQMLLASKKPGRWAAISKHSFLWELQFLVCPSQNP